MKLVHYSSAPVTELRAGDIDHPRVQFKPNGLWVSDDDTEWGWRAWCISERFGLDRLTHVHDVALAPGGNVLVISDSGALVAFHNEFRLRDEPDYKVLCDWPAVMRRYDGVIITPYIWQRRLDLDMVWYYGWDCASGCIWQPRAIASVVLREIVPVPEPED